ncbi:MAG: bifunctional UDP-N-acetylmuramoyl-tripeptide:D-alanyl-D-alanine ligase/alanine racemase [Bacteroidaceae bacterium]|nr:bifunctional UDP-N-acetylmuramoyl-tripeptide:D-alanyl-D-alanine ligase/alanine racemase [Bacteroidaceae bacterium]
MHYTLSTVASFVGARCFGNAERSVEWLLTDSRSLAFPETTLFLALRTPTGDGRRYIPDLYRRGVRQFCVGELPEDRERLFPEACFLLVLSPLKALQRLAERHREEFDVPVVGITGSNGKTVVKEWLYQLLQPSRQVTRSPRSYNSQVGVPLSVCQLSERTQLAIFEAGISQPGEMPALQAIIQPTIGVLTNIGAPHQENFATPEEKCVEKLALFKDSQLVVYNGDDKLVSDCMSLALVTADTIAWSRRDASASLYIKRVEKLAHGTRVHYVYLRQDGEYTLPFIDNASVENSIHCLAVCLYLHLSREEIAERMARLEPVAMRLEVIQGVRGCTLINDSYNSDLHSLDIALDFMSRRADPAGRCHTLILSDILQSGLPAEELYGRVAEMVSRRGVQKLIGVGTELKRAANLFYMDKHFFEDTESLLNSGLIDAMSGDVVLIKGARQFGFERITEKLARRVHETTLDINLSALCANLNHYRSFLQPSTRMVCMVKASAYGTGSIEVAKTLQDRGVHYLAVAVADEGAELRAAGITRGIIVMNPEMTSFGTLFRHRLEPEVYSFALLEALISAAKQRGIVGFPVHVKLDTGMSRLGFHPENDLPRLIDRLTHQNAVIVRSVFSHFAGADSTDFDDFTNEQFRRFEQASQKLQDAFPHKILRHICNSAAIARFPERHLDMVRLGIGLYGIDPVTNKVIHNVATLKTTILQIRNITPDTTVGYSRRGTVEKPSRIAAIPIGYADGLDRHLGNRNAYCLVNGKRAPYVGNICMDVCMIDVTDIDCKEGDTVEVFGDNLPVTVLSDRLGTIPYEILTSVSERVKRVYFQD